MTKTAGAMLIGGTWVRGDQGELHSLTAATGEPRGTPFGAGGAAHVDRACALAEAAFDAFRETAPDARARFLEDIAQRIEALGASLVDVATEETGLPRGRIENERGRTANQLRLFAGVLREGSWTGVRLDTRNPTRTPAPKPDLRLRMVPVGPVAVFGASNFPLAFSTAGGDTASALAAGCPVIVKAHGAHMQTSAMIAGCIDAARSEAGLPAGVFSMLIGAGSSVGAALVADPRINAVGFTGSRGGGQALMKIAAARPQPIPVYAEMSSVNPVLLFAGALEERAPAIARAFAASLTLGSGQFCTNPGLLLGVSGEGLDTFIAEARAALGEIAPATMLTPGIHKEYVFGVKARTADAWEIARGPAAGGPFEAQSALFETSASAFLSNPRLAEEVFGPSALIVRCKDTSEFRRVLEHLEGQLTVALHLASDGRDDGDARALRPLMERRAGRLLVNGFGTGVEVTHAMVHGGPYPATSDSRMTSVGSLAIERFLRPVCYQDFPDALLPSALQSDNPLRLPRRIDGTMQPPPQASTQ